MQAWIAFSFSLAWLGDGPAMNQPRPQVALPLTGAVVPVVFVEAAGDVSFLPPAPLPEFTDRDSAQIRFEFSSPESCSEAKMFPAVPPAELELTGGLEIEMFDGGGIRIPMRALPIQPVAGVIDECEAPAERPRTIEELHHLQNAIQHLEAAGMHQAAAQLRERQRESLTRLRRQLEQQLETKQAELRRLAAEIEELKAALGGEASVEFRVRHYRLDLAHLAELAKLRPGMIQKAAETVLAKSAPQGRAAATVNEAAHSELESALQLLAQEGHVSMIAAPTLVAKSGVDAVLRSGSEISVPVPQSDGTIGEQTLPTGVTVKVRADILPDGQLAGHFAYEHADRDDSTAVTFNGKPIPGLNRSAVQSQFRLHSGEAMCLGGLRSTQKNQHAAGIRTSAESADFIVITPSIVSETELAGRKSYSVRLTDGTASPEPSLEPVPEPTVDPDLPPPPRTPIQLIPTPSTSLRPPLKFPLSPMRLALPPRSEPAFELPPAPKEIEETAETDRGPVI